MKKSGYAAVAIGAGIIAILAIMLTGGKDDSMGSMNMDQTQSENSSQASTESQQPAATAEPNTVIMDNLEFQQKKLSVKKGTTVTWKNNDTASHNVVFDDSSKGQVEGGKLIQKGETLSFTFNEVGSYPYFCQPHPFMKATIEVTE